MYVVLIVCVKRIFEQNHVQLKITYFNVLIGNIKKYILKITLYNSEKEVEMVYKNYVPQTMLSAKYNCQINKNFW